MAIHADELQDRAVRPRARGRPPAPKGGAAAVQVLRPWPGVQRGQVLRNLPAPRREFLVRNGFVKEVHE